MLYFFSSRASAPTEATFLEIRRPQNGDLIPIAPSPHPSQCFLTQRITNTQPLTLRALPVIRHAKMINKRVLQRNGERVKLQDLFNKAKDWGLVNKERHNNFHCVGPNWRRHHESACWLSETNHNYNYCYQYNYSCKCKCKWNYNCQNNWDYNCNCNSNHSYNWYGLRQLQFGSATGHWASSQCEIETQTSPRISKVEPRITKQISNDFVRQPSSAKLPRGCQSSTSETHWNSDVA